MIDAVDTSPVSVEVRDQPTAKQVRRRAGGFAARLLGATSTRAFRRPCEARLALEVAREPEVHHLDLASESNISSPA